MAISLRNRSIVAWPKNRLEHLGDRLLTGLFVKFVHQNAQMYIRACKNHAKTER